jgi:hypothetical protein
MTTLTGSNPVLTAMKYVIENKRTNKWLTVGGSTTTDVNHPGLSLFETKEEAQRVISVLDEHNWEVKQFKN